jgi:hypothetical protein
MDRYRAHYTRVLAKLEQTNGKPLAQQRVIDTLKAMLDTPDLTPTKRQLIGQILRRQGVILFSEITATAKLCVGADFSALYSTGADRHAAHC